MTVSKTITRLASANWKSFHDAGLQKKYWHYHMTWDDKFIKTKRTALKTEHYILYSLLRNLPVERGYENSGETFGVALANLKKSNDAQIAAYADFFGVSYSDIKRLV